MKRLIELQPFWSKLLDFRAVAEYGSLAAAAKDLGVGRSALSRSIKQLEEALGMELFHRSGRSLLINKNGEQFLATLRTGMRVIHEGFARTQSKTPVGDFSISCCGPCLHLVKPLLESAALEWPHLNLVLSFVSPQEMNASLLRGETDLALTMTPIPHEQLQTELLCNIEYGVFCGGGHELFDEVKLDPAEVLEYGFVAPNKNLIVGDPWPPSLPREVVLSVHQLSLAMEIVAEGRHLGVFPVQSVQRGPFSSNLKQVPFNLLPNLTAYSVHRSEITASDTSAIVLERIKRGC